jgi:hypothetical protein
LLTLNGLVIAGALVLAIAALISARRAVRRLERLSESYWELRYESGQLKARITRIETAAGVREPQELPPPAVPTAFVPLSSLKK